MIHRLKEAFRKSNSGAVAVPFALSSVVLCMAVGLAVDVTRAHNASTNAANALDAAALATAKFLRLEQPSDSELQEHATNYLMQNFEDMRRGMFEMESLTLAVDRHQNEVALGLKFRVPTHFGGLFGVSDLKVNTQATAEFQAKELEVSMMLDVSGSMAGRRIVDLKIAAKDLIDILIPEGGNGSVNLAKIALAPFATAVNAGDVGDRVASRTNSNGRQSAGALTKCVTERPGRAAFTDESPRSGLLSKMSSACPTNPILPLTNERDQLLTAIDRLTVGGGTAGHLGISWAWYLLSPNWGDMFSSDSAPKPYDEVNNTKVAIVMTDGEFNQSFISANGSSPSQAKNLCTNMKVAGVTVYTIGFQVPRVGVDVLQDCASSPSHFFDARNGTELREAFRLIGKNLNGLRLTS